MFQLFGVLGKSSAWKKILLLTLNFESCGVVEEGGYTTSIKQCNKIYVFLFYTVGDRSRRSEMNTRKVLLMLLLHLLYRK